MSEARLSPSRDDDMRPAQRELVMVSGDKTANGDSEAARDAVAVDVADLQCVYPATHLTLKMRGYVDILIKNVGRAGPTLPVEGYDPADRQRILAVNLTGPFLVSRALIPALKRLVEAWGGAAMANAASEALAKISAVVPPDIARAADRTGSGRSPA